MSATKKKKKRKTHSVALDSMSELIASEIMEVAMLFLDVQMIIFLSRMATGMERERKVISTLIHALRVF